VLEFLLKRNAVVAATLFGAAFTAVLLYANAVGTSAQAPGSVEASSVEASSVEDVVPAADSRRAESIPPARTDLPRSESPAAATARARSPTAEEVEAAARFREQIATSEEGEERGDAIRRLARIPDPQAVLALTQALRTDTDVRNRLLAVESLRRSAEEFADPQWVIRDALRSAADDPDEIISTQARSSYDEILKRLGTQR
jgi:hypothetical protein